MSSTGPDGWTSRLYVVGEGLRRAQCDLFLEAEQVRPTWERPDRAPR